MKKHGYGVFLFLIMSAFLTGCLGKNYERIEEAIVTQAGELSSEETAKKTQEKETETYIRILTDEEEDLQEPIVIEQEGPGVDTEDQNGAKERENDEKVSAKEELEKKNSEQSEGADTKLTLLFGGDVLLSDHVLNAYDSAGGIYGVVDEEYRKQISKADFFLVNQEFPFSDRGTAAEDKQYTFRLLPERISLFTELGINGVSLANNHALDFGCDALLDSCAVLDAAGIRHTGAGINLEEAKRPVQVEIKGRKIGIIGATRVIPVADWAAGRQHAGMLAAYDMTTLLEEIRVQKQDNDFVAVCIHWGIEKDEMPQEYQRNMGKQMIDAGADLVVGAHPHVLQGIEYYQGKPIIYSLGNFIFGSSIPRTALLEVTWEEGEEFPNFRLLPGTSSAGYTRMLTDIPQRQEFARYMEGISFNAEISEDGIINLK